MSVYCEATVRYLPKALNGEPEPVDFAVAINNGREVELPGWEIAGFELMQHTPNVDDFFDESLVSEVHHPQIEALAKELTGCDHALVSGHIVRSPDAVARHTDLGPITFVHSDFADTYGELMRTRYEGATEAATIALDRAGIDGAAVRGAKRMVILQFWRNIGEAKMDMPLAFCDARTVPAISTMKLPVKDYAGGGFDFDTLGIVAPKTPQDHAWYFFPEMSRDEVVAFRTYDSTLADSGGTFWTPHAAFHDPEVPMGKPARESIELRATCLWS